MNARTRLVAAVLLFAGCSDDTGILVEVYGDELTLAVARLDTMVIVDDGVSGAPDQGDWGSTEGMQDTIEGDLDLRVTPYRVMFRPDGVATDTSVWLAAIAYDGSSSVIGYGELPDAISFEPDAVKRIELHLAPADVVGDGCIVESGTVVVRTSNDCDSDSFEHDVDCDDLDAQVAGDLDGDPDVCEFSGDCDITNPEIFGSNVESCDGLDNDCDESTTPAPELCADVQIEGETIIACRVGQRICNETGLGDPTFGTCAFAPVDVGSNSELCSAWADCLQSAQPQDCLVDHRLTCRMDAAIPGGPCLPALHKLHDLAGAATDCSWRLVGNVQQGGWNVGLRARGTDVTPGTLATTCDAEFVVSAADTVARVFVIEADLDGVVEVISVAVGARRSDCDPQDPNGRELACVEAP